jgi:predicted nucleic acid-binding protein
MRYLTGDPPEQAERARRLIDGDEAVLIPVVALAETAFSLGRHYTMPRATIVDLLETLLDHSNVDMLDLPRELALEGLALCRPSNRVSFADALIWAAVRAQPRGPLHTFDARFPRGGIDRVVLGS